MLWIGLLFLYSLNIPQVMGTQVTCFLSGFMNSHIYWALCVYYILKWI